jgi:membrane protease YdiL (CAAX protease family)
MVILAFALWYVTFVLLWSTFWIKISLSASVLAGISLLLHPLGVKQFQFDLRAVLIGLISAALLYGVFWVGRIASMALFDFAGSQIGGIYNKGTGTPLGNIALLLFFVTGPAEEIFWRGYLQRNLMQRFGRWPGWTIATAIYAAVHLCSLNFMLVGAAAVAGAFWGAMYARLGRLMPVIISHSVWSAAIFAVLPMK